MSRSYDIDHAAEHAAACFDQMLAALKEARDWLTDIAPAEIAPAELAKLERINAAIDRAEKMEG